MSIMSDHPCECGCGLLTAISPRNDYRYGTVKGQPYRFVKGHQHRKRGVPLCGYVLNEQTGCWEWELTIATNGYGQMRSDGRLRPAHRVIYEQKHGPVAPELDLDHLCRNRRCVNPDHLEPVTRSENNRRGLLGKITAEQAAAIVADPRSQTVIAREYGISSSHVCKMKAAARDSLAA